MNSRKRLLIFTTGRGGGHRSSSNAIEQAIRELDPDVKIISFDAMRLMPGYRGDDNDESGYIELTTKYKMVWKSLFEVSSRFPKGSNRVLMSTIYPRFRRLVLTVKPDAILSLHPCFVGSVIECLQRMNLSIPVCAGIIDLVKHSRLWHDSRCARTFVPTDTMSRELSKEGFQPSTVIHSGFPIGNQFVVTERKEQGSGDKKRVLMVNPSLGSDEETLALIDAALKHDVELTVITGSDRGLKSFLDQHMNDRQAVEVLGYIHDMEQRLAKADVVITKAGPNMVLEAVRMCVPVLITGHILGQEEENYKYVVDNGYGLKCESPQELEDALGRLFENDCELLKAMSRNEQNCHDTQGAAVIAKSVLEILNESDYPRQMDSPRKMAAATQAGVR